MTESLLSTKAVGQLGENLACHYLKNKGFSILERNYWQKWGEIDVVAEDKVGTVHFVEVKTVSYETVEELKQAVARGTWRPEEMVHSHKLHQIEKAANSWLETKRFQGDYQVDVVAVRLVVPAKYAVVNHLEQVTR